MTIEFSEPTEQALERTPGITVEAFLTELRNHPGKWAVVPARKPSTKDAATQRAANVRKGRIGEKQVFEPGEYESVYDEVDGVWVTWARFVGTPEEG